MSLADDIGRSAEDAGADVTAVMLDIGRRARAAAAALALAPTTAKDDALRAAAAAIRADAGRILEANAEDVAAARAEMATGGWICCSSAMQSSWGTPGISIRKVEPAPVTAIADRHRLCSVVPEIIDAGAYPAWMMSAAGIAADP